MSTTLGALLITLRADTAAFARGMGDAKQLAFTTSSDIVGSLGKIGEQLNRLKFGNTAEWKKSTELVGGLIAGIGVAAAGATLEVSREVAEQAKQMSKLSQSYGLPIETISQLRVASKLTGVDLETLTMGFGRLAKAAEGVAESGKKTGGAFASLKINVTDADGKVRPMNALIGDVADRFSHMENGTQKTAIAMQLFGRSGAALIPFLNEGKAGMAEFTKLSDELGLTWSEKDVQAGEQLTRTFELLDLRGTAFKEQFAKGVLPALNDVAKAFVTVDISGKSAATSLGQNVGSAFKGIANFANTLLLILNQVSLKLKDIGQIAGIVGEITAHGVTAAAPGIAAYLGNQKAEDEQFNKNFEKWGAIRASLNEPSALPALKGAGGNTPFVPGLPTNLQDVSKQLDELLEKSRQALNTGDHDPVATEISNIDHLIQLIETFKQANGGRLFPNLSEDVEKLSELKTRLIEVQRAAILSAELQGSPVKSLENALGAPVSTPNATGEVQQGASLLKLQQDLQQDVNERNQQGAQIYQQTRSAAEQYAQTITKLQVLLENGNVSQDTYNRALDQEKEKILGVYDQSEKYRKELQQIEALHKQGLLDGPAYYAALKQATDKYNQAQAEQTLRTGTALQGMRVFFQQSQQQAVSWASRMHNALGQAFAGISSSISTAFSSMILGTKTVGQAFAEMGAGILTSIVDACTQMVAQWLVTHVIMAAISKLFGSNDAATKTASGVAQATMWANVAAAETLADVPFPANIAASAGVLALGLGYAAAAGASGAVGAAGFSAAGGMERVPFDGARFILHKDETVLSAPYARGLSRVIDYAASGFKASSQSGTSNQSLKAAKMPNHTFNIYGAQDDAGIVQKVRNAVRIEMKPYLKAMGARA